MSWGSYRRSKWVTLIGLPLVVVITITVGLAFGQGAQPTGALIVILGSVFSFVAVLLIAQKRDLDDARVADLRGAQLAGPEAVIDPTMLGEHRLAASLWIRPPEPDELAARGGAWDIAESSWRTGVIVCVLIPFAVVPWLLFRFVWSIPIAGGAIALVALWASVRVAMPGGTLDQGFSLAEKQMAPLGLEGVERPSLVLTPRVAQPGMNPDLRGAHVLSGSRHGRRVTVTFEDGNSVVALAAPVSPGFELAAKGERLRPGDGVPVAVSNVISPLRASSLWRGVKLTAGPDGIEVRRGHDTVQGWLCDLWLAEAVASRCGSEAAS